MFLSSDNTYLRALEPADLDFLYTLENDFTVWQVSNTVAPFSKFVLEQYLENAALDIYAIRQLRLVMCNYSHDAIGTIDLYDFDPLHRRTGIGIVVAAPYRGKGHAAEALQLLLQYCRHTLQLHQVYCSVTATNTSSLQLFAKAGFTEAGLRKEWLRKPDGNWDDVVELQHLLHES